MPWSACPTSVGREAGRDCGARRRRRAALPDLTNHCRARLGGFKVPKQLIIRDSLPRNPSGKVLKRVLRSELEARMTELPETTSGKVAKLNRIERNAWTKRKYLMPRPGSSASMATPKPRSPGSPNRRASRKDVLQSFRKPPGTAGPVAAENRSRHGAFHPRAHRHGGCGTAGDRALQRVFDFIREVPEFLRILNEAEFLRPAATKSISTISPPPMCGS